MMKREHFCNWAQSEIHENPQWLLNTLRTDEAHFTLRGADNTHNCRICAKENLHAHSEESLHSPVVYVWCDFIQFTLKGHYFFPF